MSFAVSQYRSNQVQTASPARVIVQFYDGAIKFIKLGSQGIENKDYAKKGMHLSRAHAIVTEMRANLDSSKAPELCEELDRLYVYILDCITDANMKMDAKPLAGALKVLDMLRSAWAQIADDPSGVRTLAAQSTP
ncbi:MAG TPA: flagellar export chaperone FliS [Polyangiales bacterium]|nr:flagellar export chaperone FliS [Polyangiales bacterium]